MASDVKLDGESVVAEGQVLKAAVWDLDLDSPGRRSATGGRRRALVHNFDDGLTLNWDRDYPGGVTIKGALNGDLTQAREAGGCIKAILRFTGAGPQRCFNCEDLENPRSCDKFKVDFEQLNQPRPPIPGEPGSELGPSSLPTGAYVVTFPFDVDDLAVLVTPEFAANTAVTATYDFTTNPKQIRIRTWDRLGNLIPAAFTVVVF
jgi:hypothetical protein